MLSDLMAASARRDIEAKDQAMKLASQEVTITKQDDRIQFLEDSLQHANRKLVHLKTPESTRKREFGEMAATASRESDDRSGIPGKLL